MGKFRDTTRDCVRGWAARIPPSVLAAALCLALTGCAAVTNPAADGVLVRHVPPELLARPKSEARTIPLDLLGQPAPDTYRLGAGDVLGVWIEGVLGDRNAAPQLNIMTMPMPGRDTRSLPPSFGYPVTVREDGTLRLPLIDPLRVQGLSIAEVEDLMRDAYGKKEILPPGRERIVVTLMRPRQVNVVVLRQESGNITLGPEGGLAGGKRSTGHLVDLPAYENDVLHALAHTGGLPGLDAFNEVIIFRNSFRTAHERVLLLEKLRALPPGTPCDTLCAGGQVVRIPLRRRPDEPLTLGPQDVLLQSGDVVFIEARDADLFYTAGLLPAGEHVLPRDVDLDVIQAVARVRGPLINGAFGTNQLSGNLIQSGIGNPSPALLTVLRRTPDGGQIPIRVDLHRAIRDPRERILVRAGDVLVLQEKPYDAVARYMSQTFFNFNLVWRVIDENAITGVVDIAAPDRQPGRAITGFANPR